MMQRQIFQAITFTVITLLTFLPALGVPVPSLNLEEVCKNSTLIAVGDVTAVKEIRAETITIQGHPLAGKRFQAVLQILRILKGEHSSQTLSFEFVTTHVFTGYEPIPVKTRGMFFLTKNPESLAYIPTDGYHPYTVAVATSPKLVGTGYEQAIQEIINVLESPESTKQEKSEAIKILRFINTHSTTNALRAASGSSEIELKIDAISALLERNDLTKLGIAEKLLLQRGNGIDPLLGRLAGSLQGIKDANAIPTLVRLLKARLVETRFGATYALRAIGGKDTIKPLTEALYDRDQGVRYQAVMGLARFTKQYSQGPAMDRYMQKESEYLMYWREWAMKN